MATIKVRGQADRSMRYTAIVRKRAAGKILHREAKTFTHRSAAASWAKHREAALEDPTTFIRGRQGMPTLAELIRWYIANFEHVSKWQRSKQAHLKFLERHALGKSKPFDLTSSCIDRSRALPARLWRGTGNRCE
jgi:hypothetical protein